MISDGKRFRDIWRLGDGNGDPNTDRIKLNLNNIRGHPTWKVFLGDSNVPIVRGSPTEPPKYCYLDDHACHAILNSGAYTAGDLVKFWSFDFNQYGFIKQGRKNRGPPVYRGSSMTEYAEAPLRQKNHTYIFSGAPGFTEYAPLRPKKTISTETMIAEEMLGNLSGDINNSVKRSRKAGQVVNTFTNETDKRYAEELIKGDVSGAASLLRISPSGTDRIHPSRSFVPPRKHRPSSTSRRISPNQKNLNSLRESNSNYISKTAKLSPLKLSVFSH